MQAKTNTKTNKERAPPPPNPERFGRGVRANFLMSDTCEDCGCEYGSGGVPALAIPASSWIQISTGLLCPNCICQRMADSGINYCRNKYNSKAPQQKAVQEVMFV
jgi:hypothetical protein